MCLRRCSSATRKKKDEAMPTRHGVSLWRGLTVRFVYTYKCDGAERLVVW